MGWLTDRQYFPAIGTSAHEQYCGLDKMEEYQSFMEQTHHKSSELGTFVLKMLHDVLVITDKCAMMGYKWNHEKYLWEPCDLSNLMFCVSYIKAALFPASSSSPQQIRRLIGNICNHLYDAKFKERLDSNDPFSIPCENKQIFDMRLGSVRQRTRNDLFSKTFCARYLGPDLPHNEETVLTELFPRANVRRFVHLVLGLAMTGMAAPRHIALCGHGGTGKSTLVHLLRTMFGDFACSMTHAHYGMEPNLLRASREKKRLCTVSPELGASDEATKLQDYKCGSGLQYLYENITHTPENKDQFIRIVHNIRVSEQKGPRRITYGDVNRVFTILVNVAHAFIKKHDGQFPMPREDETV